MAKKKEKGKSRPTIRVSNESAQKIVQFQRQVNDAVTIQRIYMSGLREGLGVPSDFVFNTKLCAFVPVETGKAGGE